MQITPLLSAAVLAVSAAVTADEAVARDARCRIFQDNRLALDRLCDFEPDGRNGSYILSAQGKRGSLLPGISIVSVSVVSPGVAEVRGMTGDGINSRWGEARRSASERACWVGSDFRICVY